MKILIIDNNVETLESIKAALSLNGYDVIGFTDLILAKKVFISKKIDVVITDFHLGDNCKGTDLLKFESFEKTGIPIILISGDPEVEINCMPDKNRIYKYFKKPIDIVLLLDELSRINLRI